MTCELFLEGRGADLTRSLHQRMNAAAEREQYELAAKYRDLISTVTCWSRSSASQRSKATMPTSSAITTKTRCWR